MYGDDRSRCGCVLEGDGASACRSLVVVSRRVVTRQRAGGQGDWHVNKFCANLPVSDICPELPLDVASHSREVCYIVNLLLSIECLFVSKLVTGNVSYWIPFPCPSSFPTTDRENLKPLVYLWKTKN